MIPTVGLKGKFEFKEPFNVNDDLTLRVTAVRTISDYIELGRDVYKDIYLKAGIDEVEFQRDKDNDLPIVTFVNLRRKVINIPSKYIVRLPPSNVGSSSHYSWFQAIVSLGILPNTFDRGLIESSISTSVSEHIGVEPTVTVTVTEPLDEIDETTVELAESARQAAITYKSTLLKDKMVLEAQLADARSQIEILLGVIDDMESSP